MTSETSVELALDDPDRTLCVQLDPGTDQGSRRPRLQRLLTEHWIASGVPVANAHVLDLLSGPGVLARCLIRRGAALVTCVDSSPSALWHATRYGRGRIRGVLATLPELPDVCGPEVAVLAYEGLNALGSIRAEALLRRLRELGIRHVCGDIRLSEPGSLSSGVERTPRPEGSFLCEEPHVELQSWGPQGDHWQRTIRLIRPQDAQTLHLLHSRLWVPERASVEQLAKRAGFRLTWLGQPLKDQPTDVLESRDNASFHATIAERRSP